MKVKMLQILQRTVCGEMLEWHAKLTGANVVLRTECEEEIKMV